jgi:hypothetical protein
MARKGSLVVHPPFAGADDPEVDPEVPAGGAMPGASHPPL